MVETTPHNISHNFHHAAAQHGGKLARLPYHFFNTKHIKPPWFITAWRPYSFLQSRLTAYFERVLSSIQQEGFNMHLQGRGWFSVVSSALE